MLGDTLDAKCSYQTFVKCYHLSWHCVLKFRHQGMHGKCNDCGPANKAWFRHVMSGFMWANWTADVR